MRNPLRPHRTPDDADKVMPMMPVDGAQADRDLHVALHRHAGRQVRQALPAMFAAVVMVATLQWNHIERSALVCWIVAGLADTTRAGLRLADEARRTRLNLPPPPRWWDRINHTSYGLVWGGLVATSASWGDETALWSALVVVMGVIAMAVVVSAGTTERFVVITVGALTPTFVVLVARPHWRAMAVAVVVFAAIATTVQRALHRALADAVGTAEVNRRLARRLERFLTDRDPSTSVLSRRGFAAALDELAHGDATTPVTVAVANVERLAAVNELFGEHVGDALLRKLATRLQEGFEPEGGLVGRLGGDEFAVAVAASAVDPSEVALRMRGAAAEPVTGASGPLLVELHLATAFGVAGDAADLLSTAMGDVARLRSQRRAGLRDAADPLALRRALLEELPAALARGDVAPWFQPVVDSATRQVVGWEALVRWCHPVQGVLTPDRFLPLALMGGHGDALTDVVLDRSLAFLAGQMPGSTRPLRIHVNIDPADVRRHDVVESVVGALHRHGVPPDALVLEITEQDVLAVDQVVRSNLEALDGIGVDIAVDDFGTGYSSLSHLQVLPVRQLKIDRTFTAAIDTPRMATLVEGIVGLARGMRMGVVAEGVETEDQAARLAALGCAELQGYLFSRARPAADAARDLAAAPGRDPGRERSAVHLPL